MKKLLLVPLLGLVATCEANSVLYETVGDEVVLSSGPVTGPITVITWTHNRSIIAEWFRNNPTFYKPFTGRCKLNTTTGELIISNLTLEHNGSYTAEINDKVLNTTELSVISAVPTPTISKSCDDQMTHCVLTCEGITTDSEPVTYTWWSGDVMKSETKELNITKEVKEHLFFCVVKNPVSSNRSKEVLNPFITSSSNTGNNDNSLFGLLMLVPIVGVVGVVIYKRKRKHSIVSFSPLYSCFTTKAGAAQPPVVGVINNEPETVNDLLIGEDNNTVILQQIVSAPLQQ